jgi:hypothetical protein
LNNEARTKWRTKAAIYKQAVRNIVQEIQTPARVQLETEEPEVLVTDAEAAKMRRIADKVHIAAKLDIDQANQVTGDLTQYVEQTKAAREQLKREVHGWKAEGKAVNAGYKHAFEFDMANIHYDAPRPGHAGSIKFTNTDQVVQNWRSAIQADQNMGKDMVNDLKTYKAQVQPARNALKNSINTNWKAKNQAFQNSVKDVIREIQTPARVQAQAATMIAHPVETFGTENLIIAASCAVILAGTVLATKQKKKATIEFEVDCEMAPTQKESKKVIKKTLAKIMKSNSAKATLIN